MDSAIPNPYATVLGLLDAAYILPPSTHQFKAKVYSLYAFLGYNLIVSIIYLTLYVRKSRTDGKGLYMVRLVQRPQGRYIVLNQYIWYPVGCIVTCCVWIAYIASIRHMQYSGRPERVTWWITLHPCPAFFHLYITSFIVIGAANLATSRRDAPSHHPLPPWLMNGMLLVVAPLMATCAIIPAIFAALTFDQLMDVALDITASLRRNAATYTPTSAAESGRLIQALLADIGVQLHSFNDTFWYRLRVQTGVSLTIAAILFLLTVIGGVSLVSNIRRVDSQIVHADAPVVAPLAPLAGMEDKESINDEGKLARWPTRLSRAQKSENADDLDTKDKKGSRLSWDVLLFFFTVAPVCLLYIVGFAFILTTPTTPGPKGHLLMFKCMWGKLGVDSMALTALVVKLLRDQARPRKALLPSHIPQTFIATESLHRTALPPRKSSDSFAFPHRHEDDEWDREQHHEDVALGSQETSGERRIELELMREQGREFEMPVARAS